VSCVLGMGVPWWIPRVLNSVVSFTLLVFTIPLAFDVGGRDAGLVDIPSNAPVILILGILAMRCDILLLSMYAATSPPTFAVPTYPLSHQHRAKRHCALDSAHRARTLYRDRRRGGFCAYVDSAAVGLDSDKEYAGIHSDGGLLLAPRHPGDWPDMSLGRE
jgi:hypothetical protein